MKIMELKEAIRLRHSVRRYTDQPIEPEKVELLREAIGKYNEESGLNIQLVLEEPKAFSGFLVILKLMSSSRFIPRFP